MKKRVKRKFNPLKFLSFIAFIIICYFLTVYLLDIKTKNIVVLNNNYYSDEKIIETSDIENYPKFLSLNTNKIKNLKNINDFYKVLENQNIQTYDINISKA